jgi:hypothetical protein
MVASFVLDLGRRDLGSNADSRPLRREGEAEGEEGNEAAHLGHAVLLLADRNH